MKAVRIWKVRRTSSFMMRSTYRRRYRVSLSVRPWNFSGRGSRDFESRVTVRHRTLISPRWVRNTCPRTPTMSPMSYFLKAL